jgi:hypothetical protein
MAWTYKFNKRKSKKAAMQTAACKLYRPHI